VPDIVFRFKFNALNRRVKTPIQRDVLSSLRLPAGHEFLKRNMGLESLFESPLKQAHPNRHVPRPQLKDQAELHNPSAFARQAAVL
jgi:hypothetical protein